MQGVRLGNLFWILGGFKSDHNSFAWNSWIPQEKTSIWTIEKEKWIQGPKIPLFLVMDNNNINVFCANAINSTFVMFILFNTKSNEVNKVKFSITSFISSK